VSPSRKPRIQASIAVALLEVIRAQDRPTEVLADEDPTLTMPRKLGLSGVVDAQIRRYGDDMKSKIRLTDSELRDLFGLVLRRPDSEDVFFLAGSRLGEEAGRIPALRAALPQSLLYVQARRTMKRALKKLFGRHMGGFAPGPFVLEGAGLFLMQADPGGEACHFVSGMSESILVRQLGEGVRVNHELCQARGDATCRWVGERKVLDPPEPRTDDENDEIDDAD